MAPNPITPRISPAKTGPYQPAITARVLALTGGEAFTGDADIASTQVDPGTDPDGELGPLFFVSSVPVRWSVIPCAAATENAAAVDGQGLTVDAVLVKRRLDSDKRLLGFVRPPSSAEVSGDSEPGHHLELHDDDVQVGDLVYLSVLHVVNPGGVAAIRIVAGQGLARFEAPA